MQELSTYSRCAECFGVVVSTPASYFSVLRFRSWTRGLKLCVVGKCPFLEIPEHGVNVGYVGLTGIYSVKHIELQPKH